MKTIISAVITIILGVCLSGCCTYCSPAKKMVEIPNTRPIEKTKNWYAVNFDKYDQQKIDTIYNAIISNNAYRVEISYYSNQALAKKILHGIQSNINYFISMKRLSEPIGSNPYEVTVTIYNKDE